MTTAPNCLRILPNSCHRLACWATPLLVPSGLLKQKMEVVIWKDRCDLCVGDMFKLKALACSSCGKSFHLGCLGIRIETPVHVESFICNTCEIKNGQTSHYSKDHLGFVETTPKEDRQGFIDGFIGRSFSGPNDLPVKYFSGQKGDTLTVEYLDKNGFMVPIIVQSKEHLDMKVPVQLTLKFLKDRLGWLKQLDVVNVLGRKDGMMYLDEFQDYFETENSSLILCSLSLELSRTKLKSIFQAPKVVRSIDWGVQFPQSGDLKVYTDRYLQHCMKGGFIDFHVEGGGSSIWHHICRGRELIYLIKPNEDGSDELKKFAGWFALSQGTSFFEHHNPPLRCYRIEVAEGETIFIPGGFIRASYYPEKTVIIGGNFLNIYNVETQFKCFHMENDLCIKGQYRFPNFKGFHWQVARGFSKAPSLERIPRNKHNLTRLYNELENWANMEDENGASAGCSYASKDITTQSILMEFKDYIDHCNEDDDFELEGERASEIPGTTDKGVEPSGSGATGSGPSEPTAVPGIAASFQQYFTLGTDNDSGMKSTISGSIRRTISAIRMGTSRESRRFFSSKQLDGH